MRRAFALASATVLVVLAIMGVLGRVREPEVARVAPAVPLELPAAPELPPPRVSLDDFAGAQACAACHREQYDAWAVSTHGRAGGGEPGPDRVIAPFDGTGIRFADAVVVPRVRGGAYEFVVRQEGHAETVYRVDGVIGGGHMRGGGTQGFVSRRSDGTVRFLPWDWSRHGEKWFCNTGTRQGRGWRVISPELRLADCGDWPPLRALGSLTRLANCQECHGSQIQASFDPSETRTRTTYTSLSVNCESCHGPGRRHVELAEGGELNAAEDLGLESLRNLDTDESLGVCFRCHALKDVLREGYLPGEDLESFYALKFPVLGEEPYFADGRVRTFAYQGNHLASACYLNGPMDCVSCHEPHAQGYWDHTGTPLPSHVDDGQCTSCHPSKLEDPSAHTHHTAGPNGVRCVSCHMPYLQHPEVGTEIPFARSDHTIAVPRPTFDADLGVGGACAGCHRDRLPSELEGQARSWWGEIRPHRPLIAGIVGELRARNASEAAELLLHPDVHDPLTQFQALARLLGYLRPDDPEAPGAVVEGLRALARADDQDVRALALAALHWTHGYQARTRSALATALERDHTRGTLRARWGLALGFLADHYRDDGDLERARTAYRKVLEILPHDPRVLQAVGLMHQRAGEHERAVRAFQASLRAAPDQALTHVNLGVALSALGDLSGAIAAYGEAARIHPHEPLAHFNLGNALRRSGATEEAAEAYRRAIEADPGLGRAHFELARSYILLDRPAAALPHARRAVEFLPGHEPSAAMLRDLLRYRP